VPAFNATVLASFAKTSNFLYVYVSDQFIPYLCVQASCMPAHVLGVTDGDCIDGCAAPGNKTSHMASLLGNKTAIYAFDLSQGRLNGWYRYSCLFHLGITLDHGLGEEM
jgi:hypothetical protein